MFYSKERGAFFRAEIHGDAIPTDVVEITDEQHAALMDGQAAGKMIAADADGNPVLVDQPAPTAEQLLKQVQMARAAAYADEADPLFFKAQRGECTLDDWKAKVAEIRARIPDHA